MARPTNKPSKNQPSRLNFLIPGSLAVALDKRAAEMQAERPGSVVTRSEVARLAIIEFLNTHR